MTFPSLLRPYRGKIAAILALLLAVNLLTLVLPWAIKIIIDDILAARDARFLNFIILGLAVVLCARAALSFLRFYLASVLGERIVRDLRRAVYGHVPRLSLLSINKISPAQILTRLTQDVDSVRRFLFGDAVESIYAFLNIGFTAAVLFWINGKLTAAALLTLPLFAAVYFHRLPRLKEAHRRLRELHGVFSARAGEVLNGIRVVRAFGTFDDERAGFDRRQGLILAVASQMHSVNAWLWAGIELFTSLGVAGILWLGGRDCLAGRMTAGELVAFYTYLGMLFAPVIRVVAVNASYQEAQASLSRINDVLRVDDEVREAPSPVPVPKIAGAFELDHVHFGYLPGEPVLEDIHFSVRPGETVGIVGASGAGKSTLISLLLRLFDPARGAVRVDGVDLKELDLKGYRRQIAVVLQDDFLFSGTVEDNIRYGNPQASGQDVLEAAQAARAHDFIAGLADGYRTQIGERGVNLSSGQRQRVAIARALLKEPAVLILDEATSSVDALTENELQRSLRRFMRGRTVLIVAHRFSTIIGCDRIVVMDRGRIVETGEHDDLLKKQGFYSTLYFEQFREEDRVTLAGQ